MRAHLAFILALAAAPSLTGQVSQPRPRPDSTPFDSLALRLVISVPERRLWAVDTLGDTLLSAPVAVGSGRTVTWGGQRWTFRTPTGERRVRGKEANPVWVPPTWHYLEVAREHKLAPKELVRGQPVVLADGRTLTIVGDQVVVARGDSVSPLLVGEHVVFDGVLYIPPIGTRNRRVEGTLGKYRIDLGDGIGLHGTLEKESIGKAVTHGCVRLYDADIEWLYRNVAVGTRVTIR